MIKDFIDSIAKEENQAERIIFDAKMQAEKIESSFELSLEKLKDESAKRIKDYNKDLQTEYNKKAEAAVKSILEKADESKDALLTDQMSQRIKTAEEFIVKKIKEYGNR